ncbi:MAG TPA: hypothetical protein VF279_04755, partial [Acidimicrobiales bacterium]
MPGSPPGAPFPLTAVVAQHDAGPSWTIDTLSRLGRTALPLRIHVLIGSDADRAVVEKALGADIGLGNGHRIGFGSFMPDAWSTPLATVVAPGQRFAEGTLKRHVHAVADHPEVTVSLTTHAGWER